MGDKAIFNLRGRNPDVLTSISNLSNDEVFTSPDLVVRMLDDLEIAWKRSTNGKNIWADSSLKFLDPFTKTGIFLREITKRLVNGLESEIPDLQTRVDHVLTKQVFGIAITELTSLLARRSVYCSKNATSEHSICKSFKNNQGNIWYAKSQHNWTGGTVEVLTASADGQELLKPINGRCKYCGAPQKLFDRSDDSESYAYAFIHTDNVNKLVESMFGEQMKFDVVVGNPPYQMAGGAGGSSDSSIYHLFVEQAKNLEPRFVSMVIPSRWMAGGRDMGDFRQEMLSGGNLRNLTDFPISKDVFPGVEVKGGVCYFLWDKEHKGLTEFVSHRGDVSTIPAERKLDEFDVFVRSEIGSEILRKVLSKKETSISEILSADTPFGIATNFTNFRDETFRGSVDLHYVVKGKRFVGHVAKDSIKKNPHLISEWKVLIPEAGSDGGQKIPDLVLGKPLITKPESVCTQTYLAFWVKSEEEAKSLVSYIETKFFRFLVSLRKITQHALRSTYTWVPMQTWNKTWRDQDLFDFYDLTVEERTYVESVIKTLGDNVD